ncbi:hypothetical protein U1Q18_002168 [Sarracenia purpurea var. burkii]
MRTAMISRCARLGTMSNALLLFDEMPERDIPSWSAVIVGRILNGLFSEAISLFRVSPSPGRDAELCKTGNKSAEKGNKNVEEISSDSDEDGAESDGAESPPPARVCSATEREKEVKDILGVTVGAEE